MNRNCLSAGLDLGSRLAKIVILQEKKIIHSQVLDTGINPRKTAEKLLDNASDFLSIDQKDIKKIFSTGYGRNISLFNSHKLSEIICHARGVNYYFPDPCTVIDIGGQDSKIILAGNNGKVIDFAMNDKCAAGTGRFLEVVANILQIDLEELGEFSLNSKEVIDINSTCVVFAESEIIGMIANGIGKEDIVSAVHFSIAKRIKNLMSNLSWHEPLIFTGGVSQNSGMVRSLKEVLSCEILTPPNSLITGALGAALYAFEA